MDTRFGYVFPAISGVQANREYFTSMCPLRLIPKIFYYDETEINLSPELRAQRTLNKSRIPEISRYILMNRNSYVFSSITASVDAEVRFEPIGAEDAVSKIGLLHIPMDARFIINDGQHRRAAIEMALRESPEIGDESIAVVFFLDRGLERCQQMFADLNRYAIRPSKSLGVLYDHRDDKAHLTRLILYKSRFFTDIVEMERSSLSARSRKLFTLSALHTATTYLLEGFDFKEVNEAAETAVEYWDEVAKQFPEWELAKERRISAGEIRRDFIHSHGIALQSLGKVGNCLLNESKSSWKKKLKCLKKIDWSRTNKELWEGRTMIGGRVTNIGQNVILTTNVIKKYMKLELSPEEQRLERAYQKDVKAKRK